MYVHAIYIYTSACMNVHYFMWKVYLNLRWFPFHENIHVCVCVLQRKRENAFKYFPDYFPDTGIQQKRKITYISLFLSSSLMISHDAAQACILSLGSTEKNPALIHSLWKISFLDIRRKLTHFYELCVLKKNSYFSLS